MRLDVPVVVPADNFGSDLGREDIDTYPRIAHLERLPADRGRLM
jgi:hypothetical protein